MPLCISLMRLSLLHRLTGLLLLMAHAITGTSALPAITTLAADLEGSHEVFVSQGEQGTQVLLHHRPHEYTPEVYDHDDPLTRTIVRMCRTSQEGDHKLSTEAMSSGRAEDKEKQARAKRQPTAGSIITSTSWAHRSAMLPARGIRAGFGRDQGMTARTLRAILSSVRLMV